MHKLKKLAKRLILIARNILGIRYVKVNFKGSPLVLDTNFQHERDYLKYIKRKKINGALGTDVWALSHFIKSGDTVLDAGANIGFTAVLAEVCGAKEIHCFEPDPRLTEKLKTNCGKKNFYVYAKALGEKPSAMWFFLSSTHQQGSTFSGQMINLFPNVFAKSKSVEVQVDSVDNIFSLKHFDFLKIDVEGTELEVLKGAVSLIEFSKPVIYLEAYAPFFDKIDEFLKKYYKYSYRIICRYDGSGRLFPAYTNNFQAESGDIGLFTSPPSYIYSNINYDHLTKNWTPPRL